MRVRPDVRFQSDFPDDTVEDDDMIIAWPGRNIMNSLKAAFEQIGYRVSEPISMEHAGWELDLWRSNTRFWMRINVLGADENYLMVGSSMWFWPQQYKYRPFLLDLERIMKGDQRFHNVGWFPAGQADQDIMPTTGPFDE